MKNTLRRSGPKHPTGVISETRWPSRLSYLKDVVGAIVLCLDGFPAAVFTGDNQNHLFSLRGISFPCGDDDLTAFELGNGAHFLLSRFCQAARAWFPMTLRDTCGCLVLFGVGIPVRI